MPPVGYRKRHRSESPEAPTSAKTAKATPPAKKAKPTLFDTADALSKKEGSLEESKKFLAGLDDDDQDSSLSEADSDEFEDVPPAKRRKTGGGGRKDVGGEEEDEDEDEMDWEDAIQPGSSTQATPATAKGDDDIGDVSISMNEDGSYIEPLVSAATGKKGPSKRERQIRVHTHCLHVMSLMWHNTVRNSWVNDKEAQKILVASLPEGVEREVKRWRQNLNAIGKDGGKAPTKEDPKPAKGKGKGGKKGKSSGRDWNKAAESTAPDNVQVTSALLRLLKVLASYWRKRFTVTAPGLRKQGYKDLRRLRNDIKDWEKDKSNAEDHGERIENVEEFRKQAKSCEGSRDVGGQLFVALLRGLGLEVRMVANLQPAGFGWSKAEEADPPKARKKKETKQPELSESESDVEVKVTSAHKVKAPGTGQKTKPAPNKEKPTRKSSRGNKGDPIDLDESDSPLSDAPSEFGEADGNVEPEDDDDLSVIDVTPSIPKKKPHKKYDRDLAFPIYWAEVCDPVSHKHFPVDPVVLSTIASNDELLQTFEPRGKKAEVSKQVMCYIMAYSSDGTAKDVTVRYLKRHQLPGKTKGVRMPVEKVPIYNRKGKVRRYEDYDWFRTLSSLYDRPEAKRTTADDIEEQTDLKPFKPSKEEKVVEKESLQGYKQSANYVLEQHLRREEAISPGAQPIKTFTTGKGDKAASHLVYLRSDVLVCKTVESWHKEGRAIKVGEQPLKYVPMRAVTLVRKREMEDAQRETGEKLKQGLYSQEQTDWIIPPPIENGVIPKNAFGNMDVYVPTMVPAGAIHLPLKGSAKLCRKLGIDYAEACTGFEFGKQRAVPVLTGVVVAKANEGLVRDAWRVEREEVKRKEDGKRTALALQWWRKMVLGLRVLERMRVEYADAGAGGEESNPFVLKARREGRDGGGAFADAGEEMGGGFMRSDDEEDAGPSKQENDADGEAGGGFLVEDDGDAGGGGFMVDDEPDAAGKHHALITPVSLQAMHKTGMEDSDLASDGDEQPPKKQPVKATKGRKQPAKQPASKPATKPAPKPKRARKPIASEDEDEGESSLSSLSSAASASDDDESPESPKPQTSTRRRRSSPQVVISPQTPQKPEQHSTPAKGGRRKSTRAAKKATGTRSPYFRRSGEADGEDEGVEGEEGEGESEEEVVRTRGTTTRTRGKR
ncbi:uncharacterized protein LTR77_007776 [Saxophila tyrrhenica]|uniref:Rad4-domain-containing protein n=1 Tax=Saxophila tyrrhenica TaxID=1690608 RepID=A0AAV9P612_9PEZI|nr:hypothetical protein LTR77_007776 [Saxophila tyrrhenica]